MVDAKNFDFSHAIEAVRPWMTGTHSDYKIDNEGGLTGPNKSKLTYALFSQLPEFICDYLNQGDLKTAISYMDQVPVNPKQVLISVMGFADAAQREREKQLGGWRFFEDFPLTEEEARASLTYIESNPQLALTFCILDDMTLSYLHGFLDAVNWSEDNGFEAEFGKAIASHGLMKFIKKQLEDRKQFLDELIVSFAHGFAGGKKDFNEQTLSMQLCEVFRNKAMQSCPSYYDRSEVTQCPFQPVLGALSRAVFEQDEHGIVSLSDEKRQGAFLYFLYQKAGEALQQQKAQEPQMTVDHL